MTEGLEVLVQEVMAAMQTEPWVISAVFPSPRSTTPLAATWPASSPKPCPRPHFEPHPLAREQLALRPSLAVSPLVKSSLMLVTGTGKKRLSHLYVPK